jgi:hypothetical protein
MGRNDGEEEDWERQQRHHCVSRNSNRKIRQAPVYPTLYFLISHMPRNAFSDFINMLRPYHMPGTIGNLTEITIPNPRGW